MDFLIQFEKLRVEAKRRVAAKEITVTELARRTGIAGSTMSNFLAGKRKFRLATWNKLLLALDLTTEQLQEAVTPWSDNKGVVIPVVKQITAIKQAIITSAMVVETITIKIALPRRKPDDSLDTRRTWTRYVAIRATRAHIQFMHPLFLKDTLIILDRHYQKIEFPERKLSVIYAVTNGEIIDIGYLKKVGSQLELHPDLNRSNPIPITLGSQRHATYQVVGCVCYWMVKAPIV